MRQRIAIVGSGISGLGAAWALDDSHEVVVYEADTRVGGHSNTVDVPTQRGVTRVDTGFIVFNEVTYPNLTRLFDHLGVATEPSDMSFSYSLDNRREYAANLRGVLAQPTNLLRPRFIRMLSDIERFRRTGPEMAPQEHETIGELMRRHRFSSAFLEDYLLPMTGAIWSTGQADMREFPAATILRFLSNHGLIEVIGRPRWRTVSGGSRSYTERLSTGLSGRIRLGEAVTRIERSPEQVIVHSRSGPERFDQVILAAHSDQSLAVLGAEATGEERALLGSIPYRENVAVLHSDADLMPSRKRVWSSWNAMASTSIPGQRFASVTYWMNRLQNLDSGMQLFVSLNPLREPREDVIHAYYSYAHPQFDSSSIRAQQGIARMQGRNRTWYAGAYLGYGFHEDGLQSGLNVAAALGSPAPWHGEFEPMSSALPATESGLVR